MITDPTRMANKEEMDSLFKDFVEIKVCLHKDTVKKLGEIGDECFTSTHDLIVLAVDSFVIEKST